MSKVERRNVRVVREGHGANCSSIGSVIDTLFVAQVAAGALFAIVAASLNAQDASPDSDSDAHKSTDPLE
jgi:hypothetical protein